MLKKMTGMMLALAMILSCSAVPASAVSSNRKHMDEATKYSYYQEYIMIADEVSQETGVDISVLPMSEFKEEDWRTPEEFRAVITEVANWDLRCTILEPQTRSSAGATKYATVTADGHNYEISITGRFTTGLNTATGR